MDATQESEAIRARYRRRAESAPVDRYAPTRPYVLRTMHERERAVADFLRHFFPQNFGAAKVFEVGCGSGENLATFLRFHANPANVSGCDLMAGRAEQARKLLPSAVKVECSDALHSDRPSESEDLVYISTVFSSILDASSRVALAQRTWEWVRPGGGVLCYDFEYGNPRNPDVCGIPRREMRRLYPEATLAWTRSLTLAPPIGRALESFAPWLLPVFFSVPFLRTHRISFFQKPLRK